tara:strand:- start:65 stop:454 length:390 start_codon:yes stop_codon:yes gene_type:complete
MNEPRRNEEGFTLVELVVAITILAISAGVFFEIFSSSSLQSNRTNLMGRATGVAESILEQVGKSIPLVNGETKGRTDGLIWQLSIRPFSEDIQDQKLMVSAHIVETSVLWDASQGKVVRLVTLHLKAVQ